MVHRWRDDRGQDSGGVTTGGVTSGGMTAGGVTSDGGDFGQYHRRPDQRRRLSVVGVVTAVVPCKRELWNAIEPGGGEANGRLDPPPDFLEHDETVAPTLCSIGRFGRTRTGRRRFGGLAQVVTGGDGFLQLLDIGQLCLARSRRFSRHPHGRRMTPATGRSFAGYCRDPASVPGHFADAPPPRLRPPVTS